MKILKFFFKIPKSIIKILDQWCYLFLNIWMLLFVCVLLGLFGISFYCAKTIKGNEQSKSNSIARVETIKNNEQSKKVFDLACGYMFDSSQTSGWTWVIFIFAWLLGDGVILTIIAKCYYDRLNGDFRRFSWLVEDHIVILGWDNGILTELKKKENQKKDIYVVTRRKASDLCKYLKNAGLKIVVVYRGDYDNLLEWSNKLNFCKADQVFIAGELGEDAHDARVKLLYDKLKKENQEKKIKVNIHDFGLAWKLKDNTSFENFHLKWANYLWKRLEKEGKTSGSENPVLHLYIVGFGAMGKSIVLTIPDKFKNKTITVTDEKDDKIKEEFNRYNHQFEGCPTVNLKNWNDFLDNSIPEMYEDNENENTEQNSNNNICRIVVVAEKRSEKGMYCMMDIISKLKKPINQNLTLALSQEIDGYVTHYDKPSLTIDDANVILFGMKMGCLNEPENVSK